MYICTKCGAQLPEGADTCPNCGKKIQQTSAQDDLAAKAAALNNTPDTTAQFDPQDIEKNKLMAILAYLSWLVLIPIFAAKDSKFARFHVNQGLVLAIAEIAFGIVLNVLGTILSPLWWLFSLINGLVSIVFLVFSILGIVNAANGRAKELPLIGSYRLLK